ncbi:MAG: YheU family protein [Gammaproteobacteria bacterium]|nr:YheU family protein [Gammaproteobacteria bacterium]
MIVPHSEIDSSTLHALIEEFVTRDGTDYGEHEVPTDIKISQILRQLDNNEVFIVYSELHESCTIVSKDKFLK